MTVEERLAAIDWYEALRVPRGEPEAGDELSIGIRQLIAAALEDAMALDGVS